MKRSSLLKHETKAATMLINSQKAKLLFEIVLNNILELKKEIVFKQDSQIAITV
jgi:hypothetical protein